MIGCRRTCCQDDALSSPYRLVRTCIGSFHIHYGAVRCRTQSYGGSYPIHCGGGWCYTNGLRVAASAPSISASTRSCQGGGAGIIGIIVGCAKCGQRATGTNISMWTCFCCGRANINDDRLIQIIAANIGYIGYGQVISSGSQRRNDIQINT